MSKKAWDNFILQINDINNRLKSEGCIDPFYLLYKFRKKQNQKSKE